MEVKSRVRIPLFCIGAFVLTLSLAREARAAIGDCNNNGTPDLQESSWANRDDDGDGICNGVDTCPYEPNAAVGFANGDPSACTMRAITVPWIPTNPSFPHSTYSGANITLKGIARYGGDQFKWDFGDGASTDWTGFSNAYDLSVKHVYSGDVGRLFIATLSVRSSSDPATVASATYPVAIQQSSDLTDPNQMDVRINMAIDEGLWWLHTTQSRSTFNDGYSAPCCGQPNNPQGTANYQQPYGFWSDGNPAASTCASMDAFQLHGSKVLSDYNADPYVEDVRRALAYSLWNTTTIGISQADRDGNPDTNGNGFGIRMPMGDNTYVNGICATAFASTGAPGKIANSGPSGVYGRSFAAITQDMVDYFAWGQSYGCPQGSACFQSGGWWYASNANGADGSTNQWPILSLSAAVANMGSTVPDFVKKRIPDFIAYTHHTTNDALYGGWGYRSANEAVNPAKTAAGMLAHYFVGDTLNGDQPNQDLLHGIGFLYRRWTDSNSNNWNGNTDFGAWNAMLGYSYAMYGVMKAMRTPQPNILRITDFNDTGTQSFDWYYTPAGQSQQGIATNLVSRQQPDGSWFDNDGEGATGHVHTTAWDTLILAKGVTVIPPAAAICNCSATWDINAPVTLDGSCSSDADPSRIIVKYDWDFNYDGSHFNQTLDSNGFGVTGKIIVKQDGFNSYTEAANGTPNGVVHKVALRVKDNTPAGLGGPLSNVTSCNVTIKPPPHCPNAVAGGPYLAQVGQAVTVDASASFDVDADPLTFKWDFHNNGLFADATGATASVTFNTPGIFPIAVQATDHPELNATPYAADDCSVPAFTTVEVGAHTPVSNAGGPYTSVPNNTITLDGSASSDPDGLALTYAWDLQGNGLFTDSTDVKPSFHVGDVNPGASFTVCLKVSNGSKNNTSCAVVNVVHQQEPPVCVLVAPAEVDICSGGQMTIAADASNSYDLNGNALTYLWTSDDCPAFDNPTAAVAHVSFATAHEGCQKACTAHLAINNGFFTTTCDKTITINDKQTPAFTSAPSDATFECGPGTTAAVNNWLTGAGATDICAAGNGNVAVASDFVANNGCGGVGLTTETVTFTATNACDGSISGQRTAQLTVRDTTAPVLTGPGPLSGEATGTSGRIFNYNVTASDFVSGNTAVTCTPASGSAFPVGVTTVNCQSTDGAGNTGYTSFTVTTTDTTPPVLSLPGNFLVPATTAAGAIVTYTATATDIADGTDPVTCSPASGTQFPAGLVTVNCSATDKAGNTSTGSFVVTVWSQPPHIVITNPANGSVQPGPTTGLAWARASDYNPPNGIFVQTVTYWFDGAQIYSGSPAGAPSIRDLSAAAPGTHNFTVKATDNIGNSGTATSNFTYSPNFDTLLALGGCNGQLNALPGFLQLNQGQQNSLCVKLRNGAADEARGSKGAAANILGAYMNEIDAYTKTGKLPAIADSIADTDTNWLIAHL